MSEASKSDVDVVDLTENASATPEKTGSEKPVKKMKQLRLPFAPIQKNIEKTAPKTEAESSAKKRKHSEDLDETNKKPALDEDPEVLVVSENGPKKAEPPISAEPKKTETVADETIKTPKSSSKKAKNDDSGSAGTPKSSTKKARTPKSSVKKDDSGSAETPKSSTKKARTPKSTSKSVKNDDSGNPETPKSGSKKAKTPTNKRSASKCPKPTINSIEKFASKIPKSESSAEPEKTGSETPKRESSEAAAMEVDPAPKTEAASMTPISKKRKSAVTPKSCLQTPKSDLETPKSAAQKLSKSATQTPMSPSMLEECRRKVKVEAAKISLQVC